ncbi:sensor histidine kinase [Zafaria sp. J156]|uniref:sensor histidine kinase n=1 Tax=Zafaria sp. J156 TaxID=3116490 RepID=UPI002E794659|nr:histidine kinase [Zafaria sp. J156]MEE1621076.1 histidine kinase [Zafaria sp. J156]
MTAAAPWEGPGTPDPTFAELADRRRGPVLRFIRQRPGVVDLLVVAGYLLVSAFSAAGALDRGTWVPAAAVAGIAVALAVRRRWTFAVLAAVMVLEAAIMIADPLFGAGSIGLWIALYTAATKYASKRMFIMAVLVSAVEILLLMLWVVPALDAAEDITAFLGPGDPRPSDVVWLIAAFVLVFNSAAVGIGAAVRSNRLHDAELTNWGLRVRTLAQAGERNRIAREMHDVVAHSLSVMIALSDGAAVVLKRDPDRAAEVLRELSSTGRGALADMRRVIGVLRDGSNAPLAPQPASSSLKEMLDGFRVAGVPLRFSHEGPALPTDAAFQLTVYRIVQESLTNVLRYGRGVTRVTVELSRDGDTVRIKVADNGQLAGTPREPVGSGQGLKGIAERTAIYDGSVYAGPGPQGGWVVHAILTAPRGPEPTTGPQGEDSDEPADAR